MNPSSRLACEAAAAVAGTQHYPTGALYVVATPIGNLADIGLRALHVLALVDAIACEDTRHTGSLLKHFGLEKPLLAAHEHNENQAAAPLLDRLRAGQRVAYVSDAGTPGLSDPGSRLVAAARAAGLKVIPIPGPSSPATLISVAGLPAQGPVIFAGFLPAKGSDRAKAWQRWTGQAAAVVLLEAPHRIEALAADIATLGTRQITLGRELTKQFEEVVTLPAADLPAWLAQDSHRRRGEFTLLLHPPLTEGLAPGQADDERAQHVLSLLLAQLPLKTAVQLAAEITGAPRKALYQQALEQQGR